MPGPRLQARGQGQTQGSGQADQRLGRRTLHQWGHEAVSVGLSLLWFLCVCENASAMVAFPCSGRLRGGLWMARGGGVLPPTRYGWGEEVLVCIYGGCVYCMAAALSRK